MLHVQLLVILLCVDQRGLRVGMTEKRLELIQRHPAVEADGGEGVTEFMRIGADACPLSDFLHNILQRMRF